MEISHPGLVYIVHILPQFKMFSVNVFSDVISILIAALTLIFHTYLNKLILQEFLRKKPHSVFEYISNEMP